MAPLFADGLSDSANTVAAVQRLPEPCRGPPRPTIQVGLRGPVASESSAALMTGEGSWVGM